MLKKYGTSLMIIVIIILGFSFAAMLEYNNSIKIEQASLQEELVNIQTNIENIISARVINANVFTGIIELDKEMNKDTFDIFAEKIYTSESHVVKDIVFITDTTISHVYPTYLGKESIGIDLSELPDQRDLLLYTKEKNKTVFFGPIDLVEGGQGIIVRVPVVVDDIYFGQVAIVFDYMNFVNESGLNELAKNNKVVLEGSEPFSDNKMIIWANGHDTSIEFITEKIYLHDIVWHISALPLKGWNGFSTLFFLILAVGVFICILASVGYQNEVKLKVRLKAVNEGLQETIEELAKNKTELTNKYNEIIEKEIYIQHLADHDELTGLYNRRLFREHLEEVIKEGKHGLVVLIDIDDFKNINDIHGHLYGDELLKAFAVTMQKTLRNDCRFYRFGGDEFLILFDIGFDDDTIYRYSRFIRDKLKSRITSKVSSPITLSAGVVRYPEQGNDPQSLLIRADVAMYKSKSSGKNQITIFKESLLETLDYKISIENHIREALKNNGFSMYYQPIINTITGEVISFEALIRLNDRTYNPMEFIEVAESTGFIIPLGNWILDEVFMMVSTWLAEGLNPKPVAINLSPRQLIEPTFRSVFFSKIEKATIPMELIEVEITENVFLENEKENISILKELRSKGIKISMDDFGTGYSSLKYLTYLPLDKVKIDKSLKDELIKLDNSEVLSGIISMVHGLGMTVVAEGIEDVHEWQFLQEIGCDYLQGYLFSKPVSSDKVPSLLARRPLTKPYK